LDISQQPPSDDLRVLFISAEADPFVRVGGLGDVSGSLPQALRSLSPVEAGGAGIDIRLVIPFHGIIDPTAYDLQLVTDFPIPYQRGAYQAKVYSTQINGLPVYLISGDPFLKNAPVYALDARLDGPKFTFFSLAALELARRLNWSPDVLHANDWHTALAVYALSLSKSNGPFFARTQSVLSIHNLGYLGGGAEGALPDFNLPTSTDPRLPDWARQMPLPLGLLTADKIVAVSPTYAQEILTPEFGCGVQGFLATRGDDLTGILNGIDTTLWNPETDVHQIAHFNAEDLSGRAVNKRDLQNRFSMPDDPDIPLLISIGRMDPQKGIDLTIAALRSAVELGWQAIILGTGIPALEAEARQLEIDFPERVRAVMRFDNRLSHQMYAGADLLLMPSRYEPCGLAQMIAMRYGCVPLAHATGGLVDSILDVGLDESGTGFLFYEPSADALFRCLQKAFDLFSHRLAWQRLQQRGMGQDFGWKRSARAYSQLYSKTRDNH
jgi:starch synthase